VDAGRLAPEAQADIVIDADGDFYLQKSANTEVTINTLSASAQPLPTVTELTFSAFIQFGDQSTGFEDLATLYFGANSGIALSYGVNGATGDRIYFSVSRSEIDGNDLREAGTGGAPIPSDGYAHVALRIDGQSVALFLNGVEIALEGDAQQIIARAASGNTLTQIGFGSSDSDRSVDYANVYVFEDALSDAQIAALGTETPALVNDAPLAASDVFTVAEEGTLSGDLFAANPNTADSDPEGDTLSVISVNGDDAAPGREIVLASGATLNVRADGTFDYGAAAATRALAEGEQTTDRFLYTITDGLAGTSTAAVDIVIGGENDAPRAFGDSASTDEDTILLLDTLLANDGDPDGSDTIRIVDVDTSQSKGTAQVINDTAIIYDPTVGFQESRQNVTTGDSFRYIIEDSHGVRSTAFVTVKVAGRNDAPEPLADAFLTTESTAMEITTEALLQNDEDPDIWGTVSFVGLDTTATQGLVILENGVITYDPNGQFAYLEGGQSADDTFSYTVEDQFGAQATALVTVTVPGDKAAPNAVNDAARTDRDVPVSIDVLANDTDADTSDTHSVEEIVTAPKAGTAQTEADGTITYTPLPTWFGKDIFTYRMTDAQGALDTADVVVSVTGPQGHWTSEITHDTADAHVWSLHFDIFDGSGARVAWTEVKDDGRLREVAFSDAVRSAATVRDTSNVFEWDYADRLFQDDGLLMHEMLMFDDGRMRATEFTDGVRHTALVRDIANASDWLQIERGFGPDGVIVAEKQIFDDGRVRDVTFQNGLRETVTVRDVENALDWTQIDRSFGPDGVIVREKQVFDDGRLRDATFKDGVLATVNVIDSADAFQWAQIDRSFGPDGVLVEEVRTFDDGRLRETKFQDGIRKSAP